MKTPVLLLASTFLAAIVACAEPPATRPPVTVAESASREAVAQAAAAGVTVPAAKVATYLATDPTNVAAGNGEAQLQAVLKLLRDYRATYGNNPVGNNAEIARALRGANPRGVRFADDATLPLSAQGEVLDRWGHPLYFHPISAAVVEVRSAGPDGKMWTADDLVAR